MNTPQPKQIGGSHYEALAYSPSQFCFALGGIYNKCRKEFLPQFTGAEQTILRKLLPSNLYKNSHRLSEVKKSILSYIERIELDKKRES